MNYDEAVRSLLSLGRELGAPRQARSQKFGLDNIVALASDLGNPHLAAPCAHIAGTNGKGSTAAMLESILRTAGLRTGLYTSPHLERINERIRIDGQDIPDEDFAALRVLQDVAGEFCRNDGDFPECDIVELGQGPYSEGGPASLSHLRWIFNAHGDLVVHPISIA